MKRIIIVLLSIVYASVIPTSAFLPDGRPMSDEYSGLESQIVLARETFRLGEPMMMQFRVMNTTANNAITFDIVPDLHRSIILSIIDSHSNPVALNPAVTDADRPMTTDRPDLFESRSVTLYPGETYSVSINLAEWFIFENEGQYLINGYCIPNALQNHEPKKISANRILFQVKPGRIMEKQRAYAAQKKSAYEQEMVASPQGTIRFILDAKQHGRWADYFRYQDMPQIIMQFSEYASNYAAASPQKRLQILEEFKQFEQIRVESRIKESEVLDVVFTPGNNDRCRVSAFIHYDRAARGFKKYIYNYSMYRKDNTWRVDGYTVTVSK